jgi:HPt (histidine-containing phosphotransfer) domain-containing protein
MLRRWLGDDEATLRSLLADFVESARRNQSELAAALESADWPATVFAAHNLRGGALSVGAHALARTAAKIEAAARAHDAATCRGSLGGLGQELDRVAVDIETAPA